MLPGGGQSVLKAIRARGGRVLVYEVTPWQRRGSLVPRVEENQAASYSP